MQIKSNNPAVIFGLSETGLAIGRSLGKQGISVYGISFSKEIGYFSRYIKGTILPHPENNEVEFKKLIAEFCSKLPLKPVLFIASDVYLMFYARNSSFINRIFLSNLPDKDLITDIQDKYIQYKLALKAGIDVPETVFIDNQKPIKDQISHLNFPVFIKARDVNIWRTKISGSKKGFVINENSALIEKLQYFNKENVPVIVQEIVRSSDDKNYKVCVFISPTGEYKLVFTLRKIHQNPIHFGIAVSAVSCVNDELISIGKKLFSSINYKGVGSAEFKYDERDGKLKLIEINSRYWQQNALADFCGMNFPLMDYLEAIGYNPKPIQNFTENLKYLNIFPSIESYIEYKKSGEITFIKWLKDIKGKKTISFFHKDDLIVLVYYIKRLILRKAVLFRNKIRTCYEKKSTHRN
jgi:D-aspartate ligase